jgi:hypothetical protein
LASWIGRTGDKDMKRIALPILISASFLAAPVSAQSTSIDGLMSSCWLEPEICVSLVEDFIGALDPNDEQSQVTVGLLAAELFDLGQGFKIQDRRRIFASLLRISAWLDGIGASQSNGVEELAHDLIGGGNADGGGGDGNNGGGNNGDGGGDGNNGDGGNGGGGNGGGNNGDGGDGNNGGGGNGEGGGDGNNGDGGNGDGGGDGNNGEGGGDGNGGGSGDGNGGGGGDGNNGDGGDDDDDGPIEASPE